MMSFWVVPWSVLGVDPVLLRDDHVEREQPGRGGVDRHRRVHLVERDAVHQGVHVALVRHRHADLADLAARQLVIGVVARLRRQIEGHREAGLALREVAPVQLVRRTGGGMTRVRAHQPGLVGLREAVAHCNRFFRTLRGGCGRSTSCTAGREKVIACFEVDGILVDPGPQSCEDTLLARRSPASAREALLLTHIHFDHAGAAGALVRRWPDLPVYVHERGAPHMANPERLVASAARLYGGEEGLRETWGEVVPVPEENLHVLTGGETVLGFKVAYTPGHASHHVCYLHEDSGWAFVGDMAGVRIPPWDLTLAPTPPPDIDVEAWEHSLDTIAAWEPAGLGADPLRHRRGRAGAARRRPRGAALAGRSRRRERPGGLHGRAARARQPRGAERRRRVRAGRAARPSFPRSSSLAQQARRKNSPL